MAWWCRRWTTRCTSDCWRCSAACSCCRPASAASRGRPTERKPIAMLPDPADTIVALSTALGPGARATVRLAGPAAFAVAARVFSGAEPVALDRRRVYSGAVRLPHIAAPLPADLYAWPAPRTYTGQDLVELHTLS